MCRGTRSGTGKLGLGYPFEDMVHFSFTRNTADVEGIIREVAELNFKYPINACLACF